MSGTNTGILTNARPLSAARIKELEREVLETGKTFVYLNENGELCFASPSSPELIKKLAWNSAYTLANEEGTLIKKEFKKTSRESFSLEKTFQKLAYDDSWTEVKGDSGEDGDATTIPAGAYYGNAVTGEWYTTMPATLNEYDCFVYEDYVYLYTSQASGWTVYLADSLTVSDAHEMGLNLNTPDSFELVDRFTKESYSKILESINGAPVTVLSKTFADCYFMTASPSIPTSVIYLEQTFYDCVRLDSISYAGTMTQWNAIVKDEIWNHRVPATQVVCSDGVVTF